MPRHHEVQHSLNVQNTVNDNSPAHQATHGKVNSCVCTQHTSKIIQN